MHDRLMGPKPSDATDGFRPIADLRLSANRPLNTVGQLQDTIA